MRRRDQCRGCGETVFWARYAFHHTPVRIDWDAQLFGDIFIEETTDGRAIAFVLPPGDERIGTVTTYTRHLCPERRRHAPQEKP